MLDGESEHCERCSDLKVQYYRLFNPAYSPKLTCALGIPVNNGTNSTPPRCHHLPPQDVEFRVDSSAQTVMNGRRFASCLVARRPCNHTSTASSKAQGDGDAGESDHAALHAQGWKTIRGLTSDSSMIVFRRRPAVPKA